VFELRHRARADDHRGDLRLGELPSERERGRTDLERRRALAQYVDDRERAIGEVVLVDRDVALAEPRVGGARFSADLSREHAGGERAPREDAEPEVAADGEMLTVDRAHEEIVL